jgi:hypothetical protein
MYGLLIFVPYLKNVKYQHKMYSKKTIKMGIKRSIVTGVTLVVTLSEMRGS